MSSETASNSDVETHESFHTVKNDLSFLSAQLEEIEALEASQPVGSVTDALTFSLSACERRIIDLTGQLRRRIEEYRSLKTIDLDHREASPVSLVVRQAPNVVTTRAPPISRCPDEILGYIFEDVVEEGSHKTRPLLTVNKQFHRVVMTNPLLWRKIFLKIDSELQEINSLSTSYVEACLERSGKILLDIVVDCRSVPPPDDFMQYYIPNRPYDPIDDTEDRVDIDNYVRYLLKNHSRYNYIPAPDLEFTIYKRKLDEALYALYILAETCGHRWRSAEFACSDGYEIMDKMTELILATGEMTNLQALKFDYRDQYGPTFPETGWSKVTEFSITGAVELCWVPLNFELLTMLEFKLSVSYHSTTLNLATLNRCATLRELIMDCKWVYDGFDDIFGDDMFDDNPKSQAIDGDVHLPLLTSLALKGSIDSVASIRFQLSRLEHYSLEPSDKFPLIDAPHVEYNSRGQRNQNDLNSLFSAIKTTVLLTIKHAGSPSETLAWIHDMKTKNSLPACLERVVVVGAGSLDLTTAAI
ncbi:hypothetical protein FRC17_010304 [Serendipita sp. 399]|nr:hypothetical protein FRC17_010304 [Serendipita sp. 399]